LHTIIVNSKNLKGKLDLTIPHLGSTISCTHIEYIYCDDNEINILELENSKELKVLSCNNNNLSVLDLNDFTELLELHCKNNEISQLDIRYCANLEELSTANNILNFKGLRLPTGITPKTF
jgi:hypothetical protein